MLYLFCNNVDLFAIYLYKAFIIASVGTRQTKGQWYSHDDWLLNTALK